MWTEGSISLGWTPRSTPAEPKVGVCSTWWESSQLLSRWWLHVTSPAVACHESERVRERKRERERALRPLRTLAAWAPRLASTRCCSRSGVWVSAWRPRRWASPGACLPSVLFTFFFLLSKVFIQIFCLFSGCLVSFFFFSFGFFFFACSSSILELRFFRRMLSFNRFVLSVLWRCYSTGFWPPFFLMTHQWSSESLSPCMWCLFFFFLAIHLSVLFFCCLFFTFVLQQSTPKMYLHVFLLYLCCLRFAKPLASVNLFLHEIWNF